MSKILDNSEVSEFHHPRDEILKTNPYFNNMDIVQSDNLNMDKTYEIKKLLTPRGYNVSKILNYATPHRLYDILFKGKIILDDPDLVHLYYIYGVYYAINEDYNKAQEYYRKASSYGDLNAIYSYGYMLQPQNVEKAQKCYEICIQKGNLRAIPEYGSILESQGKYIEAEALYLQGIAQNDPISMVYYADLLYRKGETNKARMYYLQAIELGEPEAMHNYAVMCVDLNDLESAKVYYFKALKLCVDLQSLEQFNRISNKMEQFYYLSQIPLNIDYEGLISRHLQMLSQDPEINIFQRRIDQLGKLGDCHICAHEQLTLIPSWCVHYMCIECYLKVDQISKRCPMCRYPLQ